MANVAKYLKFTVLCITLPKMRKALDAVDAVRDNFYDCYFLVFHAIFAHFCTFAQFCAFFADTFCANFSSSKLCHVIFQIFTFIQATSRPVSIYRIADQEETQKDNIADQILRKRANKKFNKLNYFVNIELNHQFFFSRIFLWKHFYQFRLLLDDTAYLLLTGWKSRFVAAGGLFGFLSTKYKTFIPAPTSTSPRHIQCCVVKILSFCTGWWEEPTVLSCKMMTIVTGNIVLQIISHKCCAALKGKQDTGLPFIFYMAD